MYLYINIMYVIYVCTQICVYVYIFICLYIWIKREHVCMYEYIIPVIGGIFYIFSTAP